MTISITSMDLKEYKRLYVIGNGFDLHHGMPTSYRSYRIWLEENHHDVYKRLNELYSDGMDEAEWWNDFETNLGYVVDLRGRIENTAWVNQPTEDELERDRVIDGHRGAGDVQEEMSRVIDSIKGTFHEWVDSLPKANSGNMVKMETADSFFINFNYTNTLENVYKVSPEDILHIHGGLGNDEYVIGHGRNYNEVEEDAEPSIEPWDGIEDPSEYGIDASDDMITEHTKKEYVKQIMSLRKPVPEILTTNKDVFDNLHTVKEVHIYGLSFSDVDAAYLRKIVDSVSPDATFEVNFFSDRDKEKIKDFFAQNGRTFNLIRLKDIMRYKQGELFE